MSYEPTLIILKKDLEKHRELFEDGTWQYGADKKDEKTRGGEDGQTVMEWLFENAYREKAVKISGIELVLCTPSFSSYNALVRKKLDELGIEYAVSY